MACFGCVFTDALNAFDGGVRQIQGPKGTAGIWATYPQSYLSIGNGLGDQVNHFVSDRLLNHSYFMSMMYECRLPRRVLK